MNLVSVTNNQGQIPLAQRQRLMMAEALQQQAATTATPAGKRGLAVGAAQIAAGLLGGIAEGQTINQIQQGGQAVRDAQARMLQNYAKGVGAGAMPQQPPGAPPPVAQSGNLPAMARGGVLGNPQMQAMMAAQEQAKGLPPGTLSQVAQIESNGNPNALNKGSGASGLFQFIPSTASHYGLSDPTDPVASTKAAAQLMADNASALRKGLGRDPTPGELYLAHQQGAGGALALLQNPSAPAASVVGQSAVTSNGGSPGMSAGQFANMWTSRMAGGPNPDMPAPNAQQVSSSTLPPGVPPPDQWNNAPSSIPTSMGPQGGTMPSTGGFNQALGVAAAQAQGDPSLMGATLPTNPSSAGAPPAAPPSGAPSPYGIIPPGTGDPEAQSLAMALQNFGPNSTAPMSDPTSGGGMSPIPGSAYAPPAALSGGSIDANVAPARGMNSGALPPPQFGAPAPGLTAANPNGAPGAMLQPSDMLNNAPAPIGMDDGSALGGHGGMAQGAGMVPGGGAPGIDPAAQSLAMALGNFSPTTTPQGTSSPNSWAPMPGQTTPSFQAGTTVGRVPFAVDSASNGIADAQGNSLPSFTGLPETNGHRIALSNSPAMGGGAPTGTAMAANVPLPPVRPSQDALDALAGNGGPPAAVGLGNVQTDANGQPVVSQGRTTGRVPPPGTSFASTGDTSLGYAGSAATAPAAQAIGSAYPQADMPAPNAVAAMGQGYPGSLTAGGPGGGFSPIGKQAEYQSPQAFNAAQAGGAPSGGSAMLASLLQGVRARRPGSPWVAAAHPMSPPSTGGRMARRRFRPVPARALA